MTSRMLRTSLGLIALGSLYLAPAAYARPDQAHLIVPGQSIGPVHLDDTEDALRKAMGAPDDVKPIDTNHHLFQWRKRSLVVGFEGDRVVLVATNSNQYSTSMGLKVGDRGEVAKEFFPTMVAPKVKGMFGLTEDSIGINFLSHPVDDYGKPASSFELPDDWTIDEINIFRSADGVITDYKELPVEQQTGPKADAPAPKK